MVVVREKRVRLPPSTLNHWESGKMKTENIRGFRDFIGEEAEKISEIRKKLIENFEKYNFEPVETPIVEYEEFVRGENKGDEAVSDIFTLQDKGKRKLALRYEFTFQLKRIMENKKLPFRRYQIGPVFRDEPTKEGRLRQFTQADVDTIGSTVKDEAEILSMTNEALKDIGIKPIILVNNRKLINEILNYLKVREKDKEQVLREIDKFGKVPESEIKKVLKKYGAEKFLTEIKKGKKFFDKFESYKEILNLDKYCKIYGVEVGFSPTTVRGLSYYNGNVFEIMTVLKDPISKKLQGSGNSIAAGGSYEFNGVQCTGISFGLERLSLVSKLKTEKEKTLVISLNQDKQAIKLAQKLRTKGKNVSLFYGKPSKALEYANSYNFSEAIFVGEKEIRAKKFKIKNLKTGKESLLKL